ncbi:helix-turn-helix domain-containing protein [Clostridiaceae bacterium 68-1-5]|uniref:Stage 0 sporulation protein A homolog n=1 Tax=Suipraeoptans intestinalis TaxID=2606628 RepID=A0A6N7UTK3_9FIRM|nr:helix-turn-helix domain-containing protein [Suipraeoptans intestinalis]
MYKILIADDEEIVINALTFIIDKHFPGICSIKTAKSGRMLIETAEEFGPDIAFIDIQMPGINGISAMKEVRKTNASTIFIIVSAFDKFDYAREAIQLGVMRYINKPIEKTQIVETLKKAMEQVDQQKKKRSSDLQTREKLEIVVPIIESGLIYTMLSGKGEKEGLDSYISLLDIREKRGNIMVIKCGDLGEKGELANAVGTSIRIQGKYPQIKEIIKRYFSCIVGAMMGNMIVVYLPGEGMAEEEEYDSRIRQIEEARKMGRDLQKEAQVQTRIAFGSNKEIHCAVESYQEALQALAIGTGLVVHAKDLPIGCSYEGDYPIALEKQLYESVEQGDLAGTLSSVNQFFEWMVTDHGDSPMDVKLKVLEMVFQTETIGYKSGGMTYRFSSRSQYLQDVTEMEDYGQLRRWFEKKVEKACRNVMTKKEESSVDLVEQAKNYIKETYKKDLSLDEVSRELKISPYYFSKLFKKKTGKNFIEYLTEIRIQRAKELLGSTDMSMKEVCAQTGYSDPNYFSRIFKKQTGVSPTEYKEGSQA